MKRALHLYRNDDWTPTHWRCGQVEYRRSLEQTMNLLMELGRTETFRVYTDNNRDRQLWCYKCAGEDP